MSCVLRTHKSSLWHQPVWRKNTCKTWNPLPRCQKITAAYFWQSRSHLSCRERKLWDALGALLAWMSFIPVSDVLVTVPYPFLYCQELFFSAQLPPPSVVNGIAFASSAIAVTACTSHMHASLTEKMEDWRWICTERGRQSKSQLSGPVSRRTLSLYLSIFLNCQPSFWSGKLANRPPVKLV